ncbi:hypothetical protein [Frankia sp. AgPm24]|uniref:hypothetical protein n=1 Tax=Frankia sp. AgPm24 TaxID=631128 RepID=UPI00200FA436|nr:hypothetical protein [Frankia sp. AgPm24]
MVSSNPRYPSRPPGAPGTGWVFALAFVVILVPGIAVDALLAWVGVPIGPAALLGLLAVLVGLGFFPTVLRRLGWVPARKRRS